MMRREQMQRAVLGAPRFQQPIARRTRRGLDVACGMRTLPDQCVMRDAARGERRADLLRLGRGLPSQSMIDGECNDGAAAPPHPRMREQCECKTIGSAGNRDGQARRPLERSQPIEPRRKLLVTQGSGSLAIPIGVGHGAASGRAAQSFLLGAGAITDLAGGLGVVAVEALIGAAGVVFLAGVGQ